VFADVSVSGADEVKQNWDEIKAAERRAKSGGPGSALDGVPFGQPALALAAQLQRRAERSGVPAELADLSAPRESAPRESAPRESAPGESAPGEDTASELGAELFALVARARAAGLDPELELLAASRAYRDRVVRWEQARST
jgi:XTP/dITP diphosphohydrolase